MLCPYCNNPLPPNVNQCPSCGAPVSSPAVPPPQPQQQFQQPQYQPQQYQQMPYQQPYQQQYQQPYPAQQVVYSDCSRLIYIVLALFLGTFGIHNFYVGRIGSGVAQLLISIFIGWLGFVFIVWIWVFVELFAVTRDGQGRLLR